MKTAADLKLEGNALYRNKSYQGALDKYQEAIERDSKGKEAWLNKGLSSLLRANIRGRNLF